MQAQIPREVTLALNRVLTDKNNRAVLAYLVGASLVSVWEPGIGHDEMMIREGSRRFALDILQAAGIETIDPYLAVSTLGGAHVNRTEHTTE